MTDVRLRPPTEDDIPRIIDLYALASLEVGNDSRPTPEDIRASWTAPGFELNEHFRLAEIDGVVAGQAHVFSEGQRISIGGFTDPSYRRRGAGHSLLAWSVQTARSIPRMRAAFSFSAEQITDRRALLEEFGFTHVRSFIRMVHTAPASIAEPDWPDGISLRPFEGTELAEAAKAAYDGSFIDHWDFEAVDLEYWKHELEQPNEDPSLWFIAVGPGGEIAGLCRTTVDPSGSVPIGHLGPIGTTRPFRGIGLGRALLRHGVRALADRGVKEVALGVDSENPSGAVRLYENNGFERRYHGLIYELPL